MGARPRLQKHKKIAGAHDYPETLEGVLDTETSWKDALDLANKIRRPAVGSKNFGRSRTWH